MASPTRQRCCVHTMTAPAIPVSFTMTAAALLGFSCSGSLLFLCLFAVPLGLGAGAIDTALNNYVSLHYSATHMSFLHCFYGVGVSVSPYILSLVIDGKYGWRGGYRIAFLIQSVIMMILFFTLGVWKKAHGRKDGETEQETKVLTVRNCLQITDAVYSRFRCISGLSPKQVASVIFRQFLREIARIPGVKMMWCLFLSSCAIECTCGGWGSTFLVEYKHMAAAQAAGIITFYYAGMALGRFLSGILAVWLDSWKIIRIGQWILGAAIILLFLPGPPSISAAGLFLIGLGNGPLFPNFNYLTPQNFGEDISQSVMGTQMAAAYVGIMLAPAFCGVLGQAINMGVFPVYLLAFYLVMAAATRKAKRILNVPR